VYSREIVLVTLKLLLKMWGMYNAPGSDKIPTELIQAGNTLSSEIKEILMLFVWGEELPKQ
jgi:hypothetical protein